MNHLKIDLERYPRKNGEAWWIVHPNNRKTEFRIPIGAITVCTESIEDFRQNVAYSIVGCDNHNGWVTVSNGHNLYDMPQYLFARHFDAEVFIVGAASPEEMENAVPFDYKPTLPSSNATPLHTCQFAQFKDDTPKDKYAGRTAHESAGWHPDDAKGG